MVNRPAGGARSQKWERSDYDFYRESPRDARHIFDNMTFGPPDNLDLIYDPACGKGNILDIAKERGHQTLGSDIVKRGARHPFILGDFLNMRIQVKPRPGQSVSIICNSPYSYEPDIAEKFMREACVMPIRRAVFIVPIAFLCGQDRWSFFVRDLNPSHILIYSQRPTMPPGNLIDSMVSPYEGGMADYIAVVFTGPRHRWKTQTIWMRPDTK